MSLQSSLSLPQTTQQLPNGQNNNNNSILVSGGINKQVSSQQSSIDGRSNLGIEEIISEDEARRRREQLNRRPSYRMILKDLETLGDKPLKKELSDPMAERSHHPHLSNNHPPNAATAAGANIRESSSLTYGSQIGSNSLLRNRNNANAGAASTAGMLFSNALNIVSQPTSRILNATPDLPSQPQPQPLPPVANSSPLLSATAAAVAAAVGNSLVLPTSGCDIISLKPSSSVSADTLSAAVSAAACSTFSQNNDWQSSLLYNSNHHTASANNSSLTGGGIGQANTPGSMTSLSDTDDSNRKRQVRLLKNREAAKECRRKKKEYVKCLENRVAVLENQNKALIEELKTLKELYCRKEKSDMP